MRRIVSEAASGIIVTRPNPVLEIFDRVSALDPRNEDPNEANPATGYIGRIALTLNLDSHFGGKVYEQEFRLGGLRKYSWTQLEGPEGRTGMEDENIFDRPRLPNPFADGYTGYTPPSVPEYAQPGARGVNLTLVVGQEEMLLYLAHRYSVEL